MEMVRQEISKKCQVCEHLKATFWEIYPFACALNNEPLPTECPFLGKKKADQKAN